jgi:hypothetical protein
MCSGKLRKRCGKNTVGCPMGKKHMAERLSWKKSEKEKREKRFVD